MIRKTVSSLLYILFLLLTSCNHSLPDKMPDLAINSDELEFNTYISLSAPKDCNTYQSGNEVCLEIKNLTQLVWNFNITSDILIYRYDNKEWQKVSDNMENIGATDLTLGPKGEFPLDARLVGVLPDVELNQLTNLRIVVIVHEQTEERGIRSKGAFVDVILRP